MPRFQQAVMRPEIALADGEAGRPIASHRDTGDILEHGLGEFHVGEEDLPRLLARPRMAIAVACDFVPTRSDLANQLRIAFGNPAKREKVALVPCSSSR